MHIDNTKLPTGFSNNKHSLTNKPKGLRLCKFSKQQSSTYKKKRRGYIHFLVISYLLKADTRLTHYMCLC